MNIKKIVTSLVTLIVLAVGLTGATFALFSDTASFSGNTFTTGTADLLISSDDNVAPDGPDGYEPSITGVDIGSIFPGFSTDKVFWLKNDSNADISMVTTATLLNLGGTNKGDLPTNLLIKFTCDTDSNGLGVGDTSTPEKTVSAWIADPVVNLGKIGINIGPGNAGSTSDPDELLCKMTASLPSSADNSLADKEVKFDVEFVGTQAP